MLAPMNPRIKLLRLNPLDVIRAVYGMKKGNKYRVSGCTCVLGDFAVCALQTIYEPLAFLATVTHPSFEEVPPGQIPPFIQCHCCLNWMENQTEGGS
jgi:hypothetical protein